MGQGAFKLILQAIWVREGRSPETLVRRFFGGTQRVRREWIRALATADDPQRVVFVAEHDGAIIGVTEYERSGEHTAEAGLVVRDDWQNNGLGTILLRELFRAAGDFAVSPVRPGWQHQDSERHPPIGGRSRVSDRMRIHGAPRFAADLLIHGMVDRCDSLRAACMRALLRL